MLWIFVLFSLFNEVVLLINIKVRKSESLNLPSNALHDIQSILEITCGLKRMVVVGVEERLIVMLER